MFPTERADYFDLLHKFSLLIWLCSRDDQTGFAFVYLGHSGQWTQPDHYKSMSSQQASRRTLCHSMDFLEKVNIHITYFVCFFNDGFVFRSTLTLAETGVVRDGANLYFKKPFQHAVVIPYIPGKSIHFLWNICKNYKNLI